MQIKPIFTSLRRHKAGTFLIALQIALTLAIVCNALFIIRQRIERIDAPSGIDEANIFVIVNQWVGQPTTVEADARVQADLAVMRRLPGVRDATASTSYPLRGGGWDNPIMLSPEQTTWTSDASVYTGDEHFLNALGVRLVAGRNFRPDEMEPMGLRENIVPAVAIITQALADQLFPHGDALGKSFYSMSTKPITVIGIVDRLQTQSISAWQMKFPYQAMIWPLREAQPQGAYYIVRAQPGQRDQAMRAAPKALRAQNPMRIIDAKDGLLSFAQVRQRAYDRDRGMAILMTIISAVLLAITAAGIVGLTSFWVGQRRKQIGVRRALGATRHDILSYFLTENFLISLGGVLLGVVLAYGINLWMVTQFEMERLSLAYMAIGVVVLMLLGQGAVLAPALRASNVPPVEATRSV